uniref:Ion transport domain-containing protein n=1 Tax=Grammatophora oceanica TaxID=210454 RepID=A0A7S1VPC1_9STRA|mmetsp:Transcript_52291/g.78122  ORF Transcript_52291/g.78122 Transcript_52291/m.78122 type:complete len:1270 (+) Transcript_52291:57-3866(+)
MSETTPLLETNGNGADAPVAEETFREHVFEFLEARTPAGRVYERFTMFLIVINVFSFILATLFVEGYNEDYSKGEGICQQWCDTLWFGNNDDNYLSVLNIGSTSVLEIFTVVVFSIDYLCRIWTADLESSDYAGIWGRIKYLPTFYSVVDLASTLPFYVDSFALPNTDLAASQFLRMFRLFRMMRVEGRYDTALTMFDDVLYEQKDILGTALFVGVTTWIAVSSLYYLVERRSNDMIYCGAAPDYCGDPDEIDVSLCEIDAWGITDCSAAGCPPTDEYAEPCYNLYKSIPMASYYALLNLFGEFPLIDQHSVAGMVVGTIVAIVAVAVFALPAGIIGNGFEDLIERRRAAEAEATNGDDDGPRRETHITEGFVADASTTAGSIYNFMFARTTQAAEYFDDFINFLVVGAALTFMLDTVSEIESGAAHVAFDIFELFAVTIFTVEYILRIYSIKQDPKYAGLGGRVKFMWTFLMIVDLLTVAPFWIEIGITGQVVTPTTDTGNLGSTLVKTLRLLRLLRFEKYTHAFRSFDDVISDNIDVLAVTGFTAMLVWVFFAAILYFTERDNPDEEMAANYNNVPNAMWMTLLNLTGESPLAQYSVWGKIITGVLGLFATGLFGIPIGVLGAGFEEVVAEENEDDEDELNAEELARDATADGSNSVEKACYLFVNGAGSKAGQYFEIFIYILILLSIAVGIWQTVDGHEDDFGSLEWFSIVVFTIEFLIRFIGAPADPLFGGPESNGLFTRIRFIFSFYSIIDLFAILPFYYAIAFPAADETADLLRLGRLIRLLRLDKYVPSISLIDDVVRLKQKSLVVAGYAAGTLWILFSGLIYLTEHTDDVNEIDNVPLYGCYGNCTMEDRFQDYFDSWVYTGVHLTGDYPITTYTWPAKFVNFFMVIAAVGVVSVPSGLIANGFVTIVDSKTKAKSGEVVGGKAGDDWYEVRRRELATVDPPLSRWGPTMDKLQNEVNEYLNGSEDENGDVSWTPFARFSRIFIFTVIILNVVAVLVESVPEVDRAVGNQPGNFFDTFEFFSVVVFATEYALRLFCAPKNRNALYSSFIYATTFFGIVDFLSTAPWFIEQALIHSGVISEGGDSVMVFRVFRVFRVLQLEDFVVAFSMLDNVFRASKDVFKATGLLAVIIWVGCAALFYIFEENNPNWRSCDSSVPAHTEDPDFPGCYDFPSTSACNEVYDGLCEQKAFTNIPNALYFTAVFLGGEWGVIDFTWPGRFVCLFLCVAGIGLYAIPIGTLFDSFGAILGMGGDDEEEEDDEEK